MIEIDIYIIWLFIFAEQCLPIVASVVGYSAEKELCNYWKVVIIPVT